MVKKMQNHRYGHHRKGEGQPDSYVQVEHAGQGIGGKAGEADTQVIKGQGCFG